MLNRVSRYVLCGLGALSIFLAQLIAHGQDQSPEIDNAFQQYKKATEMLEKALNTRQGIPAGPAVSKHWIGVHCEPVDDVLKAQLGLEGGVVVREAFDGSPAQKAGIKPHDILLECGEKKILSTKDLLDVVLQADGKEMTLAVLRGGKREMVTLTPAERPAGTFALPLGPPMVDRQEIRRWLEQLRDKERKDIPGMMWFARPGLIIGGDVDIANLPPGVSIAITKKGDEPAKIKVQKGEDTWEVTENDVDQLPEDIRKMVKRYRGRSQHLQLDMSDADEFDWKSLPRLPGSRHPSIQRQFEEMEKQMKQIQEQIEKMRQQQPGTELET